MSKPRHTRIQAQLEHRRVDIDLVVERCEEQCGGWIVALPDLPNILIHAEDPTDLADLILWMHRMASPTDSTAAHVSTTRRGTEH
jgi:hypothetical protein